MGIRYGDSLCRGWSYLVDVVTAVCQPRLFCLTVPEVPAGWDRVLFDPLMTW